jgi:fucose permease
LTSIVLLAAFTLARGPLQYAILLCAGFTAVMFVPAAVAVTQDVVHPGLRAVSLSLCVIVQHILGSSLGPPVIGVLSDRYGLEISLICLPLFTALAGLLFLIAARFHSNDLKKMEALEVDWQGHT